MNEITSVINEVNNDLEKKVQEYINYTTIIDTSFQLPTYLITESDFSIYYPKPKPFQRVIGTVNITK